MLPGEDKTRDNRTRVAFINVHFISQTELDGAVARVQAKLHPDVVRIRHSIGSDTSGNESIFFRIVLSDPASNASGLGAITGHVASVIFDTIRPYENLGLIPYFTFRSNSEQAGRNEAEWN